MSFFAQNYKIYGYGNYSMHGNDVLANIDQIQSVLPCIPYDDAIM
jgi:hypothetical protein